MKILLLGDNHGDTQWTQGIIGYAHRNGVDKIFQLGDLGVWTHEEMGIHFVDTINEECRKTGIVMYALGGNHEHWGHWNWALKNYPTDKYGFTMLRTHVHIAPRLHAWRWDHKVFYSMAGGTSIDKMWRLDKEKETGPRTLWWEEEQITDQELDGFISVCRRNGAPKADYVFSHDCSDKTPFYQRLKPDFESQIHRQRVDRFLSFTRPEMHFHGHMHTKYDRENMVAGDHGDVQYVQTYGLECNNMYWSYGILDTEKNSFEWGNGQ